jgi:hypothetical protein
MAGDGRHDLGVRVYHQLQMAEPPSSTWRLSPDPAIRPACFDRTATCFWEPPSMAGGHMCRDTIDGTRQPGQPGCLRSVDKVAGTDGTRLLELTARHGRIVPAGVLVSAMAEPAFTHGSNYRDQVPTMMARLITAPSLRMLTQGPNKVPKGQVTCPVTARSMAYRRERAGLDGNGPTYV